MERLEFVNAFTFFTTKVAVNPMDKGSISVVNEDIDLTEVSPAFIPRPTLNLKLPKSVYSLALITIYIDDRHGCKKSVAGFFISLGNCVIALLAAAAQIVLTIAVKVNTFSNM